MSVVQFQCPTCQAPLRLQDRALFLGRTFACPDCAAMLLIEAHGHDGVSARTTTAAADKPRRSLKPKNTEKLSASTLPVATLPDFGVHLQPRSTVMDKLSRRPALLGWSVAILFAIVLFAVISSSGKSPPADVAPVTETDQKPVAPPAKDSQADHKKSNTPSESELMVTDQDVNSIELTPNEIPQPLEPVTPEQITLPDNKPDAPKSVANNPLPEPPDEPVPEAPKIETTESIEARLKQKLARFEQVKPVPFVKLLDVLEDLVGVPIVWDLESVDEKQLQKPVTLKLPQTTVGEILDAVLKQVGLERRIVDGRIELVIPK